MALPVKRGHRVEGDDAGGGVDRVGALAGDVTVVLKTLSAGSRSTTDVGTRVTPGAALSLVSGLTETLTFCGVVALSALAAGAAAG